MFTQTTQLTHGVGVKVINNLQNLTYDLPVGDVVGQEFPTTCRLHYPHNIWM